MKSRYRVWIGENDLGTWYVLEQRVWIFWIRVGEYLSLDDAKRIVAARQERKQKQRYIYL